MAALAAKDEKAIWQQVVGYDWKRFSDYSMKRQFSKYAVLGESALPEDKFKQFHKTISDMESIYSKAKVCDFKDAEKCDLALEPGKCKIFIVMINF